MQVSDDSELAIALATGLCDPTANSAAARDDGVAKAYCEWLRSNPFDCGMTCRTAFQLDTSTPNLAAAMRAQTAACNGNSKANGALMRLCPLIIYGHKLGQADLVKLVQRDATLSHCHQTCQDANAVYAVAVSHLINKPGDSKGAFAAAELYATSNPCEDDVKEWLAQSKTDCSDLDCTALIGFVKWAFILSFWHLLKGSTFRDAMVHTLGRSGDTDTNAAIVGCMMGALHGTQGIPEAYRKVLDYSYETCGGRKRPDWLQPRHVSKLVDRLYAVAHASQPTASH